MLAAIIAIFAIIADQVTKFIVDYYMPEEYDSFPFIPKFMNFTRFNNEGGGFSILDDGGLERIILLSMSTIAMIALLYVIIVYYHRHKLLTVSLAMVLGGGIGNMIDRFRLGFVIDFLHTEFIDFPTFNVADIFITCGTALLAIYIIFIDPKIERRLQAEKQKLQEENQIVSEEAKENE